MGKSTLKNQNVCKISTAKLIKTGKDGEQKFQKWLDDNNMAYIYVDQQQETFASLFKNNIKRPDFLLLIDSIGLIAVDVKNYKLSKGNVFTLTLEEELKKVLTFERLFRLPVWYVYSNDSKYDKWYWINALKAIEVGDIRINTATKEKFIAIKLEDFTEICNNDDIGKLWTQRLPSASKISTMYSI